MVTTTGDLLEIAAIIASSFLSVDVKDEISGFIELGSSHFDTEQVETELTYGYCFSVHCRLSSLQQTKQFFQMSRLFEARKNQSGLKPTELTHNQTLQVSKHPMNKT